MIHLKEFENMLKSGENFISSFVTKFKNVFKLDINICYIMLNQVRSNNISIMQHYFLISLNLKHIWTF